MTDFITKISTKKLGILSNCVTYFYVNFLPLTQTFFHGPLTTTLSATQDTSDVLKIFSKVYKILSNETKAALFP